MQAALAQLAERFECEVEEDATDVDLEEKELTEVPAVVCQLQACSTRLAAPGRLCPPQPSRLALSGPVPLWPCRPAALPPLSPDGAARRLQAVEELFLDRNALSPLPDAIGNMAALRELNARQNVLTGLPASIGRLKNLEGLFLDRNRLEALPDLSGCVALAGINVSANQLRRLPDGLCACARKDSPEPYPYSCPCSCPCPCPCP